MPRDIKKEIEKAKDYFVIVEGKKDKIALEELGFKHIFVINETGKSLLERVEEIERLAGKKKICILTDFDKKGKKLYLILKSELAKRRVHLDSSLRATMLKLEVSHIEGLTQENIEKRQRH